MESTAEQIKDIISKTGEVIETKVKLWKLKAIGKGSEVISSVVSGIFVLLSVILAFVFLSIGLAIMIGQWLGETYYGFLIMAGIYGLAGLLFYSFRKTLIKGPVSDRLVNNILN
jgi:Putative Actinobacterial Holin-X, holin superfamily III